MEKTLYVSDLDGTLLNTRSFIGPKSLELINGLVAQGMCFTYATARSLTSASRVARGLTLHGPVITFNGAFILDPATGARLSSEFFSASEALSIQTTLADCGISPTVDAFVDSVLRKSWMPAHENAPMRHYIGSRPGDPRMRPVDSTAALYAGEIFYFTCIGERDDLLPAYERFRHDARFTCTFQQELYRTEYWLEIMPREATKANAILKLKERLGCSRVVCFGDAVNDIPMFRMADECYAVANAVDALKEIATGVIGGNDEDGVARFLQARADAGKL